MLPEPSREGGASLAKLLMQVIEQRHYPLLLCLRQL